MSQRIHHKDGFSVVRCLKWEPVWPDNLIVIYFNCDLLCGSQVLPNVQQGTHYRDEFCGAFLPL